MTNNRIFDTESERERYQAHWDLMQANAWFGLKEPITEERIENQILQNRIAEQRNAEEQKAYDRAIEVGVEVVTKMLNESMVDTMKPAQIENNIRNWKENG